MDVTKDPRFAQLGIVAPRPLPAIPTAPVPVEPTCEHLPDIDDVKELLKQATPSALRKVFEIATSDDERIPAMVKLQAARDILDRHLGKAAQSHTVEVSVVDVVSRIRRGRGELIDVTPAGPDANG